MKRRLVIVLLTIVAAGLMVIVQLRLANNNPPSSQPLALAASQAVVGNSWIIECADCPRWWTELNNRMLRLDSSGRPHIAYVGKGLYYAHFDGTYWITVTIAGAPGGFEATLALDGNNYPHIIYTAIDTNSMKYAFQDASGWHIQDIPGVGFLQGYHASLELNSQGYPHSMYGSTGSNNSYSLGYTYQDASGWHSQTVFTSTAPVEYTAMDLDNSGSPQVVFSIDFPVSELKYAYQSGSEWHVGTVCSGACWYPSIVIDQNGYPHISYMLVQIPVLSLQYLYQNASGWQPPTMVDSGSSIGYFSSLDLDANGYAHISYTDFDNYDLKYAYEDAIGWHTQLLGNSGSAFTSIAVDGSNHPHIGFMSGNDLKYTTFNGTQWYFRLVDTRGQVGSFNSIAVDANGAPRISYSDELLNRLKYAWRDDTGWHNQAVDRVHPGDTSLNLDAGGYPHIGYNDSYFLKYAYQDASGWYTETVDDAWSVAGNSMQLDSNGNPHIAYVKPGLMVAYKDTGGWHYQTIDDTGNGVSLALDNADYGHISYKHFGLRYAYQDASGWYTQTVDSLPDIGDITSIALDSAVHPHIIYTYFTCPDRVCYTTQLNHAWWDGSAWYTETVDIVDYPPAIFSLAVDKAGYPHIAYSEFSLGYAYKDAAGWHNQTIDDTGTAVSLALDSQGFPHISYYNATRGELRYAFSPHDYKVLLPAVMRSLNPSLPRLELHLDEAAGATTFLDASSWGHDASCSSPACPIAGVTGIHGTSLQFDGLDDHLSLGNPPGLNFSGNLTLEAWVRLGSTAGIQDILAHGYTVDPKREVFLRVIDGSYQVGSWDGTGYNTSYAIPAGDVENWVHLVGAYDGVYWRLYRNGVEVSKSAQPHGAVQVDDAWAIGSAGNGSERFFSGRIDEAAIYPRALSANEIWLHYQTLVP